MPTTPGRSEPSNILWYLRVHVEYVVAWTASTYVVELQAAEKREEEAIADGGMC